MELFHRVYELWLRLIGKREEFTLEFRIYHAVLVISAFGMAYNVEFKYYIGSIEGSLLALIFLFVNAYLYYISRFNKQMGNNVILFAIAGNCLVVGNFFINSGVDGPTLIYSAVCVLLIIAISPTRQHRFFVLLNLGLVAGLVYIQFKHPEMVPANPNIGVRYIDICTGYFFAIALIYFTIRYARKNYAEEKVSVEEKARSIIEQQQFIVAQNIKLATLNERFEYVTKATFDAIWDWDIVKNELYWGKGYETNFGYPAGSSGEMSNNYSLWQTRVHPDDAARVLKTLQAAIANADQQFWQEQYRYLKADGTYAYVMDRGYMIRDADQKAIRIVGALQDITSLKQQELRIVEQNKRLQQIADINSHELRKPVATILGLMQLIEPGDIPDEMHSQVFEFLRITTKELDAVIKKVADQTHESKKKGQP